VTYPGAIPYRNELLRRLDAGDLRLLEPHMERLMLPLRHSIERPRATIEHIYFFETGFASIVATVPRGHRDTEVGLIGHEGMTGGLVVLGDDRSAHECYVQLAGHGIRIPTVAFQAALAESPTLRSFLLKYVQCLYVQSGYTALVNARSNLEERLARWLLMCADRVIGDKIFITHEFLAMMLGVRRPGVTVALQMLEGKALIRANRGEIVIRDRDGLFELADGTYSEPEAEYERLIGKIGASLGEAQS
jgi:CRP-like cAMP-binding protein